MNTVLGIIAIIFVGLLAFALIRNMKQHPEWFTRVNLNKAFSTMGVLALFLIGVVMFMVLLLRGKEGNIPNFKDTSVVEDVLPQQ